MSFEHCASPKTGEYCSRCYSNCCGNKCDVCGPVYWCLSGGQYKGWQCTCDKDLESMNNSLGCCLTGLKCCSNANSPSSKNRTTSIINIIPLLTSTGFIFSSTFVLGFFQSFNPKGPIFFTIFGAIILSILLSGVRFTFSNSSCQRNCSIESPELTTKFWKLTFYHSHHPPELRNQNHEFKIGSKYFCTGCYGILIGTLMSIIIGLAYVYNLLRFFNLNNIILIIPLCFFPIIFKYTVMHNMKNPLRFLSNILLPIGFCLSLIITDYLYHSWITNTIIVLIVVFGAFLREYLSLKENSINSFNVNLVTNSEIRKEKGDET